MFHFLYESGSTKGMAGASRYKDDARIDASTSCKQLVRMQRKSVVRFSA